MQCNKCGNVLAEGTTICPKCGTLVKQNLENMNPNDLNGGTNNIISSQETVSNLMSSMSDTNLI